MGIRSIFSDADGTKIAFIDDHNQGFIYSPVKQHDTLDLHLNAFNNFESICLPIYYI